MRWEAARERSEAGPKKKRVRDAPGVHSDCMGFAPFKSTSCYLREHKHSAVTLHLTESHELNSGGEILSFLRQSVSSEHRALAIPLNTIIT